MLLFIATPGAQLCLRFGSMVLMFPHQDLVPSTEIAILST